MEFKGEPVMHRIVLSSACAFMLAGCATSEPDGPSVSATVRPASGSNVTGRVKFTQVLSRVRIDAQLNALTPGEHGFHVHEKGDCSAADAMSAGGHFNPHGQKHGGLETRVRHGGDLGNVTADVNGRVNTTLWAEGISISTGRTGIIGKAIVVHAGPDDLVSDPAGNSGGRVGCGIIK